MTLQKIFLSSLTAGAILLITDEEGEEKRRIVTCKPGDMFGELAMVHRVDREASVKVIAESATLWSLNRAILEASSPSMRRMILQHVLRC